MSARFFSPLLGSFASIGLLLLCSAMAAAQELPVLTPIPSPRPTIIRGPAEVEAAPGRPVTLAPATVAWLPEAGKVVVSLKDGSQIRGTFDGLSAVAISTKFGELSIPAKMIERVTLNEDVNLSTVDYKGDRLTGVIELPTLRMRTTWGDVSIQADQLKRFPLRESGSSPYDSYPPRAVYSSPTSPYAPGPPTMSPGGYAIPAVAGASSAPLVPEKFRVHLEDKSILVGDLRRPEKIPIKLAFAEIEVPIESVLWLKRAEGAVKVRLANGDRISGTLMVDEWTIEGVLGSIRVDADKVVIVRLGPGQKRWITRTVTETTPGGGPTTRYVRELVEEFDEEPVTPPTRWIAPAVPTPPTILPPPTASPGY